MKKMKFFAPLALLGGVLLFATSCETKENEPTTKEPFTISFPGVYAHSAQITVTPASDTAYYFFEALPTDTLNAYFESDSALVDFYVYYLDYLVEAYKKYPQYEDITVKDLLWHGADTAAANSTLLASTEYTTFVFQVDPETGKALTGLTKKTFTTTEEKASTNAITFSYTDNSVTINTTDNTPYFFNVLDADLWEYYKGDGTQEGIAENIEFIVSVYQKNGYTLPIFYGNQTFTFDEDLADAFEASGEYEFFAAPFDGKVNGTIVFDAHEVTVDESTTGAPAKVAAKGTLTGTVHTPALVKPAFGHKALLK